MRQRKALITFLGNIQYDTRCFNLFNSLKYSGFDIEFVGFDWLTKDFKTIKGEKTIYKLVKKSPSIFFYFKFFSILKMNLLFRKYDVLFAEDLYALPVCIIIGKIKRAKVIYDCRELFGFLAGLKDRPFVQRLWRVIEKIFIKLSDVVIVTGKMDEDFIKEKYNLINTLVIRNLPTFNKPTSRFDFYTNYNIDKSKKLLLYQGVVVHGRGLKMIYELLKKTDDFVLLILGDGEHLEFYKNLAESNHIDDKVILVGKVSQEDLINYTSSAFVGLSLIENLSLSYYYALPNKLFEYIMAEVPVIVTNLPQMKSIVDEFRVGFAIDENDIDSLEKILKSLSNDEKLYKELKENCRKASEVLNWDIEFKILERKLQEVLS